MELVDFFSIRRSLSDIAVRDAAKKVRPDARPQTWKNRRSIRWNTLRIFPDRERRRWSRIVRRNRKVHVGQAPSRLRENYFCTRELRCPPVVQRENTPAGCSKRPAFSPAQPRRAKTRRSAGKATASEGPRRYIPHFVWAVRPYNGSWRPEEPLKCFRHPRGSFRYVEGLNDARTLLAHLFSILLDHFSEVFDRVAEGILELYLRFPFQKRARPTDIGPSDFGIIGGQRMMGDLAR